MGVWWGWVKAGNKAKLSPASAWAWAELGNKSHLSEYKHRDQHEGEAVEGRDQAAEPPDEQPAHPGHRDRASGDDASSRPPAPASQAPCSAQAATPRCPAACT